MAIETLIEQLEKVDQEAADYVRRLASGEERIETGFADSALLSGAFWWGGTPQGHDYWSALNLKLGDKW